MARHKRFVPECVIDKAIAVFMAKGYGGTSVRDLTEATRLHPGSLYNAFGGKKQLFDAALDRFEANSPFNRTLIDAERSGASPRAALEKLFAGIVERAPGGYESCLVTTAAAELSEGNPELTRRLQASFELMEARIGRLIERGQRCGEFATRKKPRELARFLVSTIQGMTLLAKLNGARGRLKGSAELALAALEPSNSRGFKRRRTK